MKLNENNNTFEISSIVFRKKADRVISVINNINRLGGITTQLMMAAACIEIQEFVYYLQEITHTNKEIDKNAFLRCSEIEKYIRSFKDSENDLFSNQLYDNSDQQESDNNIINFLKEEICSDNRLCIYMECDDYLDSWKELKTDHKMLSDMLCQIIKNAILGLEDINQILRKKTLTSNSCQPKTRRIRNNFREYIKEKGKTDEIIKKIHYLMGNKTNTAAADIIKEAMWIGLIERPTIPSIKEEFPNIKCSTTPISKKLNEKPPTKNGKTNEEILKEIRKKFDLA